MYIFTGSYRIGYFSFFYVTGGEGKVKINGQDCDKAGISVAEYLAAENYNVNHIVVEYNLTIIPKEQYDQTILKDGDEVEIVSFMGGGC